MRLLDYLANKYGTDKKSSDHAYTDIYEIYFGERRLNIRSMLEVGVNDARSIKMWEEYFPNATIYGVDMNPVTPAFEVDERTIIHTFCQTDKVKLEDSFKEKRLEIVVDDASHEEPKTMTTFNALMPLVVSGGFYCIEDMPWTFVPQISGWLYQNRSMFGNLTVHTDKGLTSTLIVVQKA